VELSLAAAGVRIAAAGSRQRYAAWRRPHVLRAGKRRSDRCRSCRDRRYFRSSPCIRRMKSRQPMITRAQHVMSSVEREGRSFAS
jgi:hypothetical protein